MNMSSCVDVVFVEGKFMVVIVEYIVIELVEIVDVIFDLFCCIIVFVLMKQEGCEIVEVLGIEFVVIVMLCSFYVLVGIVVDVIIEVFGFDCVVVDELMVNVGLLFVMFIVDVL